MNVRDQAKNTKDPRPGGDYRTWVEDPVIEAVLMHIEKEVTARVKDVRTRISAYAAGVSDAKTHGSLIFNDTIHNRSAWIDHGPDRMDVVFPNLIGQNRPSQAIIDAAGPEYTMRSGIYVVYELNISDPTSIERAINIVVISLTEDRT